MVKLLSECPISTIVLNAHAALQDTVSKKYWLLHLCVCHSSRHLITNMEKTCTTDGKKKCPLGIKSFKFFDVCNSWCNGHWTWNSWKKYSNHHITETETSSSVSEFPYLCHSIMILKSTSFAVICNLSIYIYFLMHGRAPTNTAYTTDVTSQIILNYLKAWAGIKMVNGSNLNDLRHLALFPYCEPKK